MCSACNIFLETRGQGVPKKRIRHFFLPSHPATISKERQNVTLLVYEPSAKAQFDPKIRVRENGN